jgi:ribosomal protein S18 acetylase RimI-like enzyme
MTDAEFPAWRELALEHHAAQVSRATGTDLGAATEESRALLATVLPAGLATEKMNLFVVIDEAAREVGWLWLGAVPHDDTTGFLFDIIIEATARGHGYGRATMQAAERFFLAQSKTRVSLDVAGGNDVALGLYASMGYLPISTSMAKTLDGPREPSAVNPGRKP